MASGSAPDAETPPIIGGSRLTHPRAPALVGVAAAGALIALRALQLAPAYGVSPEDWRGATAHVLTAARRGDCIAFYPSDARMPFAYYARRSARVAAGAPRPVLPPAPLREVRPYVERYVAPGRRALGAVVRGCPRVWLVSSHEGQRDGPPVSVANRARYLRLNADLATLYRGSATTTFGYAGTIRVRLFRAAR
jgi:hypothetical protein